MTPATGASAQHWQAAGIRHELLMRVLPALRHDMAGPLSVARMGNAVLKRYISAQPADIAQCLRRLDQNDDQLNQLLVAVRALGRWEIESRDTADAALMVVAGLDVSRSLLDLHGMQLEIADPLVLPDWAPIQPARALYGMVGALSYLQDTAPGPAIIRVEVEGSALRLQATPIGTSFAQDTTPLARQLRLGSGALECLAADLAWPMAITAGSVVLSRPVQPFPPSR